MAIFVFSESEKVIEGCCMKFFRFIEERFGWKLHSFQGRFPMVLETILMRKLLNGVFVISRGENFVETGCMKICAEPWIPSVINLVDLYSLFQWIWRPLSCGGC